MGAEHWVQEQSEVVVDGGSWRTSHRRLLFAVASINAYAKLGLKRKIERGEKERKGQQ